VTLAVACAVAAGEIARTTAAAPAPDTALPADLAATGLYAAGGSREIDARNRPFAPQYPLWSDGLTKRRWLYLPRGGSIDARGVDAWDFPVGTKFWKEFSLGGRPVETRMIWKTANSAWAFGTYVWNEAGTDARLAPPEGVPGVVEVAAQRRHSIPSRTDCLACHGSRGGPLGFNALQLSNDRDPLAIHGEPLRPGLLTLRDLMAEGLLRHLPPAIASSAPRIRTASGDTRAVLGYVLANCGMCHDGSDDLSVPGPSLTIAEVLADGDAVAARMLGRSTRWQVPGTADGASVLIAPGAPGSSAILVRMRSRSPSSQMPPLGTVLRDEEAIQAMTHWIASGPAARR
jgi:hypothetical protein